jgi:hypothetical protein
MAWEGYIEIKVAGTSEPSANEGPSVSVTSYGLMIVYRGDSAKDLYYAFCPINVNAPDVDFTVWHGNVKVKGPFIPSLTAGDRPALAHTNDVAPIMVYTDQHRSALYSTFYTGADLA